MFIMGKTLAGGFSVFAGVGERTREGNDLWKEMIEGVSHDFLIMGSQILDNVIDG